tara:strand:+ start:221 stop:334 length:114 start_codon:yes stop_codon:yes gene_type:complete
MTPEAMNEVHVASEHADGNAAKKHGQKYLEVSREVIK